jgi:hypothetical protein
MTARLMMHDCPCFIAGPFVPTLLVMRVIADA